MAAGQCVGRKLGKLTVVEYLGKGRYRCECECGNKAYEIDSPNLSNKSLKSCGCWRRQGDYNVKHGHCRPKTSGVTRTYRAWKAMWSRCRNPQRYAAERYVLRGITVCDPWKKYEQFLADMGECPTGLELDRIDNNKGYFPENCRWIDHKTNCQNRGY